jgi:hypothetical protein
MTGDKIKEVMDACYLAKRVRDMLPNLSSGWGGWGSGRCR